MKKVLILLAIVIIGLSGFAQVQRKVKIIPEKINSSVSSDSDSTNQFAENNNSRRALKDLNLTREQRLSVREMQQANKAKKDEIMQNTAFSEDEKLTKLKELKKAAFYNLQQILTDEQKAKMKEIRTAQKE